MLKKKNAQKKLTPVLMKLSQFLLAQHYLEMGTKIGSSRAAKVMDPRSIPATLEDAVDYLKRGSGLTQTRFLANYHSKGANHTPKINQNQRVNSAGIVLHRPKLQSVVKILRCETWVGFLIRGRNC